MILTTVLVKCVLARCNFFTWKLAYFDPLIQVNETMIDHITIGGTL